MTKKIIYYGTVKENYHTTESGTFRILTTNGKAIPNHQCDLFRLKNGDKIEYIIENGEIKIESATLGEWFD